MTETNFNYTQFLKSIGVNYIGSVNQSAKLSKSYSANWSTYGIYLAPADQSGYQVCPFSKWCRSLCLNESGHNKIDILTYGREHSKITACRIKKARAFFEHREEFVQAVVHEIEKFKKQAAKKDMNFAVRLNCTSDLSPELFKVTDNENILQHFPEVQFYDYTKVPARIEVAEKYQNYDITFSFDGHNWDTCQSFLERNGKVAVVFEKELPKKYKGFEVIDANNDDMRFLDKPGTIMGLHFHKVADMSDYETSKFVIKHEDADQEW